MSPEKTTYKEGTKSTVHHQTLLLIFLAISVEETVSPKLDYSATQNDKPCIRNEDRSVVPTAKPTTTISVMLHLFCLVSAVYCCPNAAVSPAW